MNLNMVSVNECVKTAKKRHDMISCFLKLFTGTEQSINNVTKQSVCLSTSALSDFILCLGSFPPMTPVMISGSITVIRQDNSLNNETDPV